MVSVWAWTNTSLECQNNPFIKQKFYYTPFINSLEKLTFHNMVIYTSKSHEVSKNFYYPLDQLKQVYYTPLDQLKQVNHTYICNLNVQEMSYTFSIFPKHEMSYTSNGRRHKQAPNL